jgi:microcystin-dependent protein
MAKTALRRGSQDEGNSEYFTGCPIGGGFIWFGLITKIPSNCMICNNSTLAIASFAKLNENLGGAWGTSGGNLNIPDLRGKFPRGVDGGAANDPDSAGRTANATGGNTGDNIGSIQSDILKSHTHVIDAKQEVNSGGSDHIASSSPGGIAYTFTSQATGGNETRPKNANVYFVIRVS